MVFLCIDDREVKESKTMYYEFKKYVKKNCKYIKGVKIQHSEVGDYYTSDYLIGIERKYEDYVSSLYTETLSKQIKELKENFEYAFLFIQYDSLEEAIADNAMSINPESLKGSLASIMCREYIPIFFTGNFFVDMVCKTIEKFYDGKTESKHYDPIRKKPKKRKATAPEVQLDLTSRLPGVGKKRAHLLLETFKTPLGLASADPSEIAKLPGFGTKSAKKINEILAREFK